MEWTNVMNELQKKVANDTKLIGKHYKRYTFRYLKKTFNNYQDVLLHIEPDSPVDYRQGWAYVYDNKVNKYDYCWLMLISENEEDDICVAQSRINKDCDKLPSYRWAWDD